jgi:hypothetical protein
MRSETEMNDCATCKNVRNGVAAAIGIIMIGAAIGYLFFQQLSK